MKFWKIKLWSTVILLSSGKIMAEENYAPSLSVPTLQNHAAIRQDSIPAELLTLKKNEMNYILSQPIAIESVKKSMATLKNDGTWNDIDYKDKTRGHWPVNIHLERLLDMAVILTLKKESDLNYATLAQKIISGIDFWVRNDLQSPNWWYPQIGTPKILGPLLLLMEPKLSEKQMQLGIEILNRSKIGMTGQNRVWLAGNVIYRSLLTHNIAQIDTAAKTIKDEVAIAEKGEEGIQPDFSFQQHGPQQQFGNYGTHYAEDISKWAVIFQHTPFQFEAEKIEILRNFLLNGMRWVLYKNQMDVSACGRELFPDTQISKADRVKEVFRKMPIADPPFKQQYLKATNDFDGNVHYWQSDMSIHRRKNFYTSVKMSSNRVVGSESCNSENTQGYHLGDGATYFYQTGKEYLNIFPFWNWKQIPGTTAYNDPGLLPVIPCTNGYRIASDFVGGVSDGMNGIATLAYKRDSLNAQKSWFYMGNAIICLGAGINSDEDKTVNTTINQSFLSGDVLVKEGNKTNTLAIGTHEFNNLKWLIHDNWGYSFPVDEQVKLTNKTQNGDWHNFVKRMPSEKIKEDIFTLWINHAQKPQHAKYAYYVFPAATEANIEKRSSEIEILENSKELQAIEIRKKQLAGFVFVKSGATNSKLFKKVSANQPCVLMLTEKNKTIYATLSDPTHFLKEVTIGLSGKKITTSFNSRYDAVKKMSFIKVQLPQSEEAGKSMEFVIR